MQLHSSRKNLVQGLASVALLAYTGAMNYYHASEAALSPGDRIVTGYPANFFDTQMEHVFFSDNLESAEFWAEFLGGESRAENLGYWPEVKIYLVEPEGGFESDPWGEFHDVRGTYRTRSPLRVVCEIPSIS